MKRTKLRPSEVAEQWGVSEETVIGWIRSGELRAMNAASRRGLKRRRYLISIADLEEFERAREVSPAPSKAKRQAKPQTEVYKFV